VTEAADSQSGRIETSRHVVSSGIKRTRFVLVGLGASAAIAVGSQTWAAASAPPPDDAGGLAVSYVEPPPVLVPTPFATVPVASGEDTTWVAVTNDGGAVVVDIGALAARVVSPDGTIGEPIRLAPHDAGFFVAGPNDVLYGIGFDEVALGGEVVAIPLSGDRVGTIVATQLFDQRYIESPRFIVARGPTGIIDINRVPGEVLMPYVDDTGQPLGTSQAIPYLTIDELDVVTAVTSDGTVGSTTTSGPNGSTVPLAATEWPLQIEWAPDNPGHPDNSSHLCAGPDAPVANISGGGAWLTSIGPLDPDSSDEVDPRPTMPVIVELFADGTARWSSIPDDWYVASMDVGGVLLARTVNGNLELARFSEAGRGDPPAPATSRPTTVPPLATTASPGVTCPSYTANPRQSPVKLCQSGLPVENVQIRLVILGYDIAIDGYFGPTTDAAVRQFQTDQGLESDGLVGPDTWAVLLGQLPIAEDYDGSGAVDPWEVPVDCGEGCD